MAIEFPRGGSANGRIVGMGETHLPCAVLVDTSGSMSGAMADLNRGLEDLRAEIMSNDEARGKVELCVIRFDDAVQIAHPFTSAYDYVSPELDCGGMTCMYEAVDVAIGEIQERRRQYKSRGVSSYKPFVFLLTDGGANDANNGSFDRLMRLQTDDRWNYIPVAVGPEADVEFLKANNANGFVLVSGKDNFENIFKFLSDSLSSVSSSRPGEAAKAPAPDNYQLIFNA